MWLALAAGLYVVYSKTMIVSLRPAPPTPDMPPVDEFDDVEGGSVDEGQEFTGGVNEEEEVEPQGSLLPDGWA